MTLYDEHTWGAYTSIDMPESLFSKAIWNKKSWYAYNAAMETHDLLAKSSNKFAELVSDPLYDSTSASADQKVRVTLILEIMKNQLLIQILIPMNF